ncbi:MAG: hypothetical protein WCB67_03025 [Solirubrobacteraceae bacterium]
MRGRVLIAAVVGGLAALVAVHLLLLHTYWDYSEGVYALSARLILHGADLYGQMVGAQPPGVFVTGAVLLAIHDSLEWLRFAVAVFQLGAGLIAAQIVYRVTGNRLAAILAPAAMLLTPWAVHEHGALTPELVALPVMLGATLLSVDRRRAGPAGVLCGVLVLIKLPLVIPAVALVWVAPDRRRMAAWAAATLVLGLGVTFAVAGGGFWRDVVTAQTHTGVRSLGLLKGFWAQAGWNVLGLLVAAVIAAIGRAGARDRPLLKASLALAAANVVTFLTNFKVGTGLNVTVPVEASLVPLAAIGTVFSFRAAREATPTRLARGPVLAGLCAAGAAFTLAQSVSLIASPHNPIPFLRAFSAPAWEITMTSRQLEASVAAARACPPGAPYGSAPLIAMIAKRLPPAGQPDGFLPLHSSTLAAVAAQIRAVRGVCG